MTALSKAFALALPHDEALRIQDDVGFFQAVRSAVRKTTGRGGGPKGDEDIKLILSLKPVPPWVRTSVISHGSELGW